MTAPRSTSDAALHRAAIPLGLATFLVLEVAATRLYPGGSWFDRASVGHSFTRNFFCDLTGSSALNGAPNPAAPFAKAAMTTFALTTIAFWWRLSRLAWSQAARSALKVAGTLSGGLAVLVPFLPSIEVGHVHGFVTSGAGAAGLFAGGVGVLAAFRRRALGVGWLGVACFFAAAVVTVLYVSTQTLHVDASELPVLQKAAAGVLVSWMLAVWTNTKESASGASDVLRADARDSVTRRA